MTTRTWIGRCWQDNCALPNAATFGSMEESAACAQHLEDAVAEFGVPTVVIDWEAVDSGIFDPAVVAAQVDGAVSSSITWSVDEVFAAQTPHVLAEVLALESSLDWPDPVPGLFEPRPGLKPPDAFWQRKVPRDPANVLERVWIPVTRSSHGLPVDLLAAVAGIVTEQRSKAFLHDVLWCATRDRSHALHAIDAHYSCATDTSVAAAHRAIDPVLHHADPDQDARERGLGTRRFQLAHLRRATALAQVMNEAARLEAINEHARGLIDALEPGESTFEILDAVGTQLRRVPDWWDSALADELGRIATLDVAPREQFVDWVFDLAAERALACRNQELHRRRRTEQIETYWRALDAPNESGLVKATWARQAHELAERHVPELITEARRRHDAIDKRRGMTVHRYEVEVPPEITAWQLALVACVERLPRTPQRLELLAASVDLFEDFYATSDLYVNTPFQNSLTTVSVAPVERIAATAEQREAHSRGAEVRQSLRTDLVLFGAPVLARILELFDPSEPWEEGFEFFDEAARRRLKRALELCVGEDFDTAAHLLAPLAERVVKRAVRDVGVRPIVPPPSDGGRANPGTLGTLLIGLSTTTDLAHDFIAGLLFVLTSDVPPLGDSTTIVRPEVEGLNVRNDISHGEGDGDFNFSVALMLLLCAGALGGLTIVDGKLHRRSLDIGKLMEVLGVDPAA